ncbi:ARP2/3 complex 16 kDa subunit, putative [Brugia malayi]|uniref:Actin-related protein 2/3 complex subunit 5 n=1 Tax=Brugia malayi TaxID=6279 RepID=A0A0K0JH90_BRUMA|nr:ARP2/3 complex 16 kDa subunit, putative [Brugia malayi]CDQ05097.1 Bm5034 [Brugia malayi]VIO87607.1 ARP2/3 complex 16 kDa subunit, putative [Brugia malayi]
MAKNLENTSYRKLDVDAFDPEKFVDCEDAETPGIGPDERLVNQLLQSAKLQEALKASLSNPPLKCKNQAIKDRSTALVTKVLMNIKTADIESVVKSLTDDEVNLLMKFIYKAMDTQADNATCQYLLLWHAQVLARGGYGAIIRVFCDRQRL